MCIRDRDTHAEKGEDVEYRRAVDEIARDRLTGDKADQGPDAEIVKVFHIDEQGDDIGPVSYTHLWRGFSAYSPKPSSAGVV